MSAFLFSMYLNDLHDFLNESDVQGLPTITDMLENKLDIFFKLFAILYADDTVLLAESPDELQREIDCFHTYCIKWNLKMNIDKSKIIIFSKGRQKENVHIIYNDKYIEVVTDFNYLGIVFSRTGSFKIAIQKLAEKATKALYEVLTRGPWATSLT